MTEIMNAGHRRLSDVLIAAGLVTQEQVDAALRAQRRTGRLLGETLLDLGYITESDLGWGLSSHFGIPFLEITLEMLDGALKGVLPARFMRENLLLPLLRTGETLEIVTADPTNSTAIAEVERLTGLQTKVSIAGAHALGRLLDDWLGPETAPVETSDDLLFQEITRPTNPLGPLFIQALRDRAREILLDPEGPDVRVRFRTADGLVEQPRVHRAAFDAMVDRLHDALAAAHPPAPGMSTWSSIVPFAEGTLRLTVTLLRLTHGRSLVLEIEPGPAGGESLAGFGLDTGDLDGLRRHLADPGGLIVVTGPRVQPIRRVMTALTREIDAARHRVVALENSLAAPLPGVVSLRLPDRGSPERFTAGLIEEAHVEAAVVGRLNAVGILNAAVTVSACGQLVLGWDLAPDPLVWLATRIETGAPRHLLAMGLAAIVHAQEENGSVRLTTLFNCDPLAAAIRAGADRDTLESALQTAIRTRRAAA